jgi:hypothetical protein
LGVIPVSKRKLKLKKTHYIAVLLVLLSSCTHPAGTRGIDYAYKTESGSIQIVNAEIKPSFTQFNNTVSAKDGYVFLFVTIDVKGTIPSAGAENKAINLMNSDWSLVDINNRAYRPSGLVDGKLLFEIRKPATGLRIRLGPSISVPLGSFLGEGVISADPTPGQAQGNPLTQVSNENWDLQIMEAFWQHEIGIDLLRIEPNERILAITVNLEYTGPEADITINKFVKVIDSQGRSLNFREDFILNNGAIPDGGREWLALSEQKPASRHFISGE